MAGVFTSEAVSDHVQSYGGGDTDAKVGGALAAGSVNGAVEHTVAHGTEWLLDRFDKLPPEAQDRLIEFQT
ncbi:hypothetical protein AB0N89_02260 [Amycolatopsis sp. NPDC089917]|uniref:hypothetical protein n=1 Tax=Amycolatopsis sp. NPDC089917 TaxID=3155187 RepID=UPI00342A0520